MVDPHAFGSLLPNRVRRIPTDLALILLVLVPVGLSVLLPGLLGSTMRMLFGGLLTFFVPGYAFVSALFPGEGRRERASETEEGAMLARVRTGIDRSERVIASIPLSIVTVSLAGLFLNYTPWEIRYATVVASVSGFTAVMTVWSLLRRRRIPSDERFEMSFAGGYSTLRSVFRETETRSERVVNVLLAVALLLASTSAVYVVVFAQPTESFTEFYLVTERENGTLVAEGYPTEFTRGEGEELTVGVENFGEERANYSIIVRIQRMETTDPNGTARVVETRTLHRFRTVLEEGEKRNFRHEVRPTMVGRDLRLQYLLYRGAVSENPRADEAYRRLHHWVSVTNGTTTENATRSESLRREVPQH